MAIIMHPVAPHWGAWIEIRGDAEERRLHWVAPHWGAWIEIIIITPKEQQWKPSHPTGVRGLKLDDQVTTRQYRQSHPTGVRGLKSYCNTGIENISESHPTGVRGLKS